MPKLKSHRGAAKRFRKTATGKLMRRYTGTRHLLSGKPRKRKRRLSKWTEVSAADKKAVRQMLPYL